MYEMSDTLMKGYTLSRGNPFLWTYDGNEIRIVKEDKNGIKYLFTFSIKEIDGLMKYIKGKGKVYLANSVSKVKDGSEKEGIGNYIYKNIEENPSLVQTASQLVSILHNANILYYNGKKKGMEFWINEPDWKNQLLKHIENSNTIRLTFRQKR